MTTIAQGTVVSATRRDARTTLRRAASVAVAAASAVGSWLLHHFEAIRDAGQLGGDYETEAGRWGGARI